MESLLFPWLQKVTSWGKDDVSKRCGQELRERGAATTSKHRMFMYLVPRNGGFGSALCHFLIHKLISSTMFPPGAVIAELHYRVPCDMLSHCSLFLLTMHGIIMLRCLRYRALKEEFCDRT